MASDIHMSAHSPATTNAFLEFLGCAAQQSDALFLPGDIFDVWIGDDFALQDPPAWLTPILDTLLDVSRHTRLYIGQGNRDFLMGHALAQRVGAQLLPEQALIMTDAGPLILSHGDEYCTADRKYQRFRRIVRQPFIQRVFLSLSLDRRRAIAAWARKRSKHNNQYKASAIMDVEPTAIEHTFRQADCHLMVHGHTHRPAVHELMINGQRHRRIVLPDWDYDHSQPPRGGWLSIDSQGLALYPAPNALLTRS